MAVLAFQGTTQDAEEKQIRELYRALLHSEQAVLMGDDEVPHSVPASVCNMLRTLLAGIQEGNGVVIVPVVQELTTKQAADILGVSRQYLVRLLETGKIKFHRAGSHRRIYLTDLIHYRDQRDHERHAAIQRIARRELDAGTYDTFIPPEDEAKTMAAKFELKRSSSGQFMFNLKTANGEVILTSELYKERARAEQAIALVKANVSDDSRFEHKTSKNGQPFFVLKAANGEIIGKSEMYPSATAMENSIASVIKNAPSAALDDKTA